MKKADPPAANRLSTHAPRCISMQVSAGPALQAHEHRVKLRGQEAEKGVRKDIIRLLTVPPEAP